MSVSHVSSGGERKGREDITVGHTWQPVKVYRTDGFPPIFAGLRQVWIEGDDSDTGTRFEITSGAGWGSPYATITVEVPGHSKVYEYVDITELLSARVSAIIEELTK